MKKSKIGFYALIICIVCIVGVLISVVIANLTKHDGEDKYSQASGDADYLDDLDAPELPEKEDRGHSKVRRGYIPIELGRQEG